jgi:hypothetical protein
VSCSGKTFIITNMALTAELKNLYYLAGWTLCAISMRKLRIFPTFPYCTVCLKPFYTPVHKYENSTALALPAYNRIRLHDLTICRFFCKSRNKNSAVETCITLVYQLMIVNRFCALACNFALYVTILQL